MTEAAVEAALGRSLAVIMFGTFLGVGAAAALILFFFPALLSGLVDFVTQTDFAATTSKVIAGIVLVFGLYVVWSTRRNLRDRLLAKVEEARRTQVESTLEKATVRPPYWP